MNAKARIKRLEKQSKLAKTVMTWKEFITLPAEYWERSIDALADALGVTRDEAEKFLEDVSNEQQATNTTT
jgi:hypothetical protein